MSALQFTTQYPATGSFLLEQRIPDLLYLLQGTLLLLVQDREYRLLPEDFLVINPFSPYQVLESDHAMLLCMEMPVELLRQSSSYPDERRIQCFSAEHNEGRMKYIRQVRHTFANLFTLYSRENKQSHLRSQSKALLLFDILFAQFSGKRRHARGIAWPQRKDLLLHSAEHRLCTGTLPRKHYYRECRAAARYFGEPSFTLSGGI